MKSNSFRLVDEIRDIQFITAADICKRGSLQLCVVNSEVVNSNNYKKLFEEVELKQLLRNKIFGIN
ncbi:hypothetical protein SLH46_06455 [Draconibacterium sp. IB214405]|uniref:hypothetical protein n=1 Tax=Draconibacterium sp. IB214405 TaxID=3097352 RepID=UPI002A16B6CE|nr:hypothetical protein [Draconibacterium sp. IB214405]MDX8338814.1 hypothetical protein [Draconibacterium sp. IB214405]